MPIQESGRYAIREAAVEYVHGRSLPSAPIASAAPEPAAPDARGADAATDRAMGVGERASSTFDVPGSFEEPTTAKVTPGFATDEQDTARARRYTPKQRPALRRSRPHERNTSPGRKEGNKDVVRADRAEYARTVPDLRTPSAGATSAPTTPTTPTARIGASQVVTPDTPTQPRGRPVPRLPHSALGPLAPFTPPPSGTGDSYAATRPHGAWEASWESAEALSSQPGSSTSSAMGESPAHEASIVVDPSLHGQSGPLTSGPPPDTGSTYQPLPSDPAAFEKFMQEQAAARGSRLNWKQQATLVIPRDSLGAPEPDSLFNVKRMMLYAGALVAGALVMLLIGQLFGDSNDLVRTTPTDTSTSAAQSTGMTVIASEPSGAELLLDGAIVGNTPVQVARPGCGQEQVTYMIRLRGFAQESVRLRADSQPAIRVTLTPDGSVPSVAP